ncbi:hypothetical protein CORC01_03328 [Colletotrichum orchidophilum]|uniref:Uncharacterized protein n=1 Tax=Colletotrichum orchidophilum TaxID=1209926 RepID=A0A1G4BIT1_9PEZI|nr:uncharacterized protein CORC01_03328 [Colletotrichum orchidophilum]OHF01295.1 hypothetical protein CORC01_03328 [Colletotrichum orchidophilum]
MNGQQRDDCAGHDFQNSRMSANGSQPAAGPRRRNDDSWVEVSSQPSSSSLSSIGDEIVTTGLRVGGSMAARRRRLHHPNQPVPRSFHVDQTAIQAGASSQEEYEESESEEDRCLTSSTENIRPPVRASFQQQPSAQAESEDSDDSDEIATALGRVPDDPVFRPQPNAFSHPPSGLDRRHSASSAIHQHPHSGVRPALSQRSQTRVSRGPPNFMSPAYQADNDAALRASLTTLLSCAAAARGLPKYKDTERQGAPPAHVGVGPSSQPVELRLMPESELMAERPTQPQTASPSKSPATRSSRTATSSAPSSPKSDSVDKHKRTSSSQTRSSRATKKKKVAASDEALISPTLLTWVVSAGVVVLVSVVGFGAGYVIGREVGRQEALSAGVGVNASAVADSSSCGREVIRSSSGGLRRLRWGAGVGRSVVA